MRGERTWLHAAGRWMILGAATLDCGGSPLRGGSLTAPGTEPVGERRSGYTVADCVDARGARVAPDSRQLTLVWLDSGGLVLLEQQEGFDTLVVSNLVPSRDGYRFQLLLDAGQRQYLREYRFPITGGGRLVVTDRFTVSGETHDFEASYREWVYACMLETSRQPD